MPFQSHSFMAFSNYSFFMSFLSITFLMSLFTALHDKIQQTLKYGCLVLVRKWKSSQEKKMT